MGLVELLQRGSALTVMGIDSSTHSLAFAIFNSGKLVKYGKIEFAGSTAHQRLADSMIKIQALKDEFNVEYIAIEKAVMVSSTDTAIKMGMALGVVIAVLTRKGTELVQVPPISWQSYIGNKNYSKERKAEVRKEFPDRSTSWYKNHIRGERKQFTQDYFNKMFGISVTDDDVSDAIGIAWYALNHLVP